jgi:hypothetical protein
MISFDKITEGVYIGNAYTSKKLQTLKNHGISHILVVGNNLDAHFPDEFNYKII